MKYKHLIGFPWIVFLCLNATNFANYKTKVDGFPYQAYSMLLAFGFFLVFVERRSWAGLFVKENLIYLLLLTLPLMLMFMSENSYERGIWTSQFVTIMVFAIAVAVANSQGLNNHVGLAALCVVLIGAGTNLYELFIQNNVWSESSGRSAGFYTNPNYSATSLVGYGLLFLSTPLARVPMREYVALGLIFLAVCSTFSRTGFILYVIVFGLHFWLKTNTKPIRIIGTISFVLVLIMVFLVYIVPILDLTPDAEQRLLSLTEGTIDQDYSEQRALPALDTLELISESPFLGHGVRTSREMYTNPHNMYLALAVDYGVFVSLLYLVFVLRIIWNGIVFFRRKSRYAMFVLPLGVWLFIYSFASHTVLTNIPTLLLIPFALIHPNSQRMRNLSYAPDSGQATISFRRR